MNYHLFSWYILFSSLRKVTVVVTQTHGIVTSWPVKQTFLTMSLGYTWSANQQYACSTLKIGAELFEAGLR